MSEFYTVAFFGHRYIDNILKVEELLQDEVRKLLSEHEYVIFLVGRNGDFDQCVSSSITHVRKKYCDENSSLVLVLPYPTSEYVNNEKYFEEYYNEIEICYAAAKAHPKSAFQIRNREMTDRADLVICYIENKQGGAWQTVKYAISKEKNIINIADKIN